jgi:hypothetical protein
VNDRTVLTIAQPLLRRTNDPIQSLRPVANAMQTLAQAT